MKTIIYKVDKTQWIIFIKMLCKTYKNFRSNFEIYKSSPPATIYDYVAIEIRTDGYDSYFAYWGSTSWENIISNENGEFIIFNSGKILSKLLGSVKHD